MAELGSPTGELQGRRVGSLASNRRETDTATATPEDGEQPSEEAESMRERSSDLSGVNFPDLEDDSNSTDEPAEPATGETADAENAGTDTMPAQGGDPGEAATGPSADSEQDPDPTAADSAATRGLGDGQPDQQQQLNQASGSITTEFGAQAPLLNASPETAARVNRGTRRPGDGTQGRPPVVTSARDRLDDVFRASGNLMAMFNERVVSPAAGGTEAAVSAVDPSQDSGIGRFAGNIVEGAGETASALTVGAPFTAQQIGETGADAAEFAVENPREAAPAAAEAVVEAGEKTVRTAQNQPGQLVGEFLVGLGAGKAATKALPDSAMTGRTGTVLRATDPELQAYRAGTKATQLIRRADPIPDADTRATRQLIPSGTRSGSSDRGSVTLDESTLASERATADPSGEAKTAEPTEGVTSTSREPGRKGLTEQGTFENRDTERSSAAFAGSGKPNLGQSRDFSGVFDGPEPISRGATPDVDVRIDPQITAATAATPRGEVQRRRQSGARLEAGSAIASAGIQDDLQSITATATREADSAAVAGRTEVTDVQMPELDESLIVPASNTTPSTDTTQDATPGTDTTPETTTDLDSTTDELTALDTESGPPADPNTESEPDRRPTPDASPDGDTRRRVDFDDETEDADLAALFGNDNGVGSDLFENATLTVEEAESELDDLDDL